MEPGSFQDIEGFKLPEFIQKEFAADGITAPTPVQQEALPVLLRGEHAVLKSGTGTGKTLAYLLPLLQRLQDPDAGRVVIITPAAELAMQVFATANRYKTPDIATAVAIAGVSHQRQKKGVQKSSRLIVGTPGRILELYAKKKLKRVTMMVLDEPDPILTSSGADFLREVLSRPDPKVQLVMAGATFGDLSLDLASEVMGPDAAHITPAHTPLHGQIVHRFVGVRDEQAKDVRLARFIEENRCRQAIVFANKTHAISHLYRYLTEHRLKPVTLSESRSKEQRKQAIAAMRSGEARVLITTDPAARGLDIPGVEWVLHYDLPGSKEGYVHRAGRTGRAGATGHSVAFLTDRERPVFKRFARSLELDTAPFAPREKSPASKG